MLSSCIGIFSGLVAIALDVLSRIADKPVPPEGKPSEILGALNIGSIAAAVMFGLTTCLWGGWRSSAVSSDWAC